MGIWRLANEMVLLLVYWTTASCSTLATILWHFFAFLLFLKPVLEPLVAKLSIHMRLAADTLQAENTPMFTRHPACGWAEGADGEKRRWHSSSGDAGSALWEGKENIASYFNMKGARCWSRCCPTLPGLFLSWSHPHLPPMLLFLRLSPCLMSAASFPILRVPPFHACCSTFLFFCHKVANKGDWSVRN